MAWLEILFWGCIACVAYPYALYPLALAIAARLRGRPVRREDRGPSSASIILAAYNEEAAIDRRLRELTDRLASAGVRGEIIVVSDGSTDRTAEITRSHGERGVRLIELPANMGKAAALTAGCAAARHEVLIFADARQSWAPEALGRLLENFADPAIGAVSGNLVVEAAPGVMAGVGLYWRYEKWLRALEGRVHSAVGVSGSIAAVRRALFRPIPRGTILDDVYWPLRVAMQGARVVLDERAVAYDRLPEKARDEFRRKVRTLCGNYQLLARLPSALMPWRNPICWQFLSHKIARLLVPWALIGALTASVLLDGAIYRAALGIQVAFYLTGLAGAWNIVGPRSRAVSAAASFLVLNAAAWLAFWVWITGRAAGSWGKVSYETFPAVPSGAPGPLK